jgi:hypothetical protein
VGGALLVQERRTSFKTLEIKECLYVNLPGEEGQAMGRRTYRGKVNGLPVAQTGACGIVVSSSGKRRVPVRGVGNGTGTNASVDGAYF